MSILKSNKKTFQTHSSSMEKNLDFHQKIKKIWIMKIITLFKYSFKKKNN